MSKLLKTERVNVVKNATSLAIKRQKSESSDLYDAVISQLPPEENTVA